MRLKVKGGQLRLIVIIYLGGIYMKIEEKMFKMKVNGEEYPFRIVQNSYVDTNDLALILEANLEGFWESFCDLTVNLGKMPKGKICIDKNNLGNMWNNIKELFKDNNLGTFTGESIASGFCLYPVLEFNQEEIEKCCLKGEE